jgi:hypothetical protein
LRCTCFNGGPFIGVVGLVVGQEIEDNSISLVIIRECHVAKLNRYSVADNGAVSTVLQNSHTVFDLDTFDLSDFSQYDVVKVQRMQRLCDCLPVIASALGLPSDRLRYASCWVNAACRSCNCFRCASVAVLGCAPTLYQKQSALKH